MSKFRRANELGRDTCWPEGLETILTPKNLARREQLHSPDECYVCYDLRTTVFARLRPSCVLDFSQVARKGCSLCEILVAALETYYESRRQTTEDTSSSEDVGLQRISGTLQVRYSVTGLLQLYLIARRADIV